MLLNCIAEGNGTINIKRIGAQWDKVSTTKWEGGKCCKDLILPQNPGFARKPHCLSASKSTAGFSLKSRKRGVSRQNRKVATLPFFLPVGVLSRLFRRRFLENLLKAFDAGKLQFFSSLESLRDAKPDIYPIDSRARAYSIAY
jgi:hypothetical protein